MRGWLTFWIPAPAAIPRLALAVSMWLTIGLGASGAEPRDLFRDKVANLLEQRCLSCHQGDEPKGGLSLSNAKSVEAGGDTGPVIVPGNPDDSVLIQVVSGDKPSMPKGAPALSAADVTLLREWIKTGATWPDGLMLTDKHVNGQDDHWAWQPLSKPAVPAVAGDWGRHPIDAFVAKTLRDHQLAPSKLAVRRTLIRRVTYDLHGLPPTPEEVEAFLKDDAPNAYETLIDRLLASPRYGERWGRHWLDVVHFGESHGYDKDKPRPNAWPYRDYVIDAFNRDTPYSQFVQEQLAGDVLFPDSPQGIVATGFVAAGPWDFVGHIELREGTLDKKIARSNDRDDMVACCMSTFMSLTVHCARCHNHKFDPISQEDYYRLQTVFAGVDRADRPYDSDAATWKNRRELAARQAAWLVAQKQLDEQVAKVQTPELQALDARLATLKPAPAASEPAGSEPSPSLGYHSAIMPAADATKWVQVDLGATRPIDLIALFPAHVKYGGHPGPGFGFPPRFRIEASDDPEFRTSQMLADHTQADFPFPSDTPVIVNAAGARGRYVRITATRLWERTKDWIFALSELMVLSEGRNVAAGGMVTALDSIEAGAAWGKVHLVDGFSSHFKLTPGSTKPASPTNGYHSGIEAGRDVTKWVQVDLGRSLPLETVRLLPARPTDFTDTPGFGFPLQYRVEVANDPAFKDRQTLADDTSADVANPGDVAVELKANGQSARYIRVTATRLWERTNDYVFALAELQADSNGTNVAAGATVTALDSIEVGRWSTRHLVDGYSSRQALNTSLAGWLTALGRQTAAQQELATLTQRRVQLVHAALDATTLAALKTQAAERAQIDRLQAALPPQKHVYAASHGFNAVGNFSAATQPRPVYFLNRGEDKSPGVEMAAGALRHMLGLGAELPPVPQARDEDGRRRGGLALWLTNPRNGLLRRSIVNRVWQYHFGRGLVDSPNDFGHMGQRATHPELLDWLAADFQEHGESLKRLHRQLLTSRTYQQVSAGDPEREAIDSGNQFLWRANRQRLEAEAVRDSILYVTGKLDLTAGGPSVQQFVFKDDHSPVYDYEHFDVDSPASFRRGVYRFIVRSVPDPFFDCLDAADPSLMTPKRNTTLTALQALSLLNNRFIIRQSQHLAERVQREAEGSNQVRRAVELTLSRAPTADEATLLEGHAREHGLPNTCRLLLNSNEFLFVD